MRFFYGTRGRNSYEKGSIVDRAGGWNNYYSKVQSDNEQQRASGLVEVFDFKENTTAKYGCEHYNTPMESAIEHLQNRCAIKDNSIRATYSAEHKWWKPDLEGRWVKLEKLRELTLSEGELTSFRLWKD